MRKPEKSSALFPYKTWLERALDWTKGAGLAHKWANLPNALPQLQLVTKNEKGECVADPREVTKLHALPWCKEWQCDNHMGFLEEIEAFKLLGEEHLCNAAEFAATIDLRPTSIRKACKHFQTKPPSAQSTCTLATLCCCQMLL